MTEEELEDKKLITEQVYSIYKTAFSEVFVGCMHKLHPRVELGAQAFQISKYELAVKACEDVLEIYKTGLDNIPNPGQLSLFKEGTNEK